MEFIKYIIIGLVQGLTEVLPISSSGHLKILEEIFGVNKNNLAFEIFLHLASFLAVMIFIFKPFSKMIKGSFLYLFKKQKTYFLEWRNLLYVILATIPIVLFTIILKLFGYKTSPLYIVGICLVINGILLFLSSKKRGKRKKEDMKIKDALVIGLFQCLGVFPGISRSGSCLCGALQRKINKEDAAKFAFMLFVPSVMGALFLEVKDIFYLFSQDQKLIPCYLVSFLVSTIATLFSFGFLLKLIQKNKLVYFAIYSFVIGFFTFFYSKMNGWI